MAKCKEVKYIYQEPLMQYGSQTMELIYELEEGDTEARVLSDAQKTVSKHFQTQVAIDYFTEYAKRRIAEKIREQKAKEEEENAKMVEEKEKGGNKHGKQ